MKFVRCFLVFLALCYALPVTVHAADNEKESVYERVMRTGTLRCGYYPWPPFFEVDLNTGNVGGMMAEISKAVGDILDIDVEFVQMSALGYQVTELEKGIYDAFCVDSYYVFSSIKYLDYSTPEFYAPVFVYVRADDDRFQSNADLNKADVSFVGIDGDISVTMVEHSFPDAKIVTLPANSDGAQIMMNVTTRKADAAIIDPGIVEVFNRTNIPGLKRLDLDAPVATYPIGISVLKGEVKLLNMLNGAISALQNTNSIEPILKRYDPAGEALYPVAKPYTVPGQ
ncbi:MAG: transporter substrate-binding domain-containing protein [Rhodospirillales bacterium]|nr:transporter substrate-binding domain-containing protein [Rhodospirillales bacterium]